MDSSNGLIKILRNPLLIAMIGVGALVLVGSVQNSPFKIKSDAVVQPTKTVQFSTDEARVSSPTPAPTPPPSTSNRSASNSTSSSNVANNSSISINSTDSQTSTAGSNSITLNSVSVNGTTVSLDATTNPGATCAIELTGADVSSSFAKIADNDGHILWDWSATKGSWNIKVSCGSASASTSVTVN